MGPARGLWWDETAALPRGAARGLKKALIFKWKMARPKRFELLTLKFVG